MSTQRISFYEQISKNKWKSVFLLIIIGIVLFGLVMTIGLIFRLDIFFIMIISIVVSLLYIWILYYNSHRIAIASVNAKPADETTYRQYHHIVEGLALASGLPKPKLYVMNDENINAFASGRDQQNAVICVTTGALKKLDKQELEGVLAHEISHIANYDTRFMTIATIMVGMVAIISEIFLRSLWYRGDDRDNRANILLIVIAIVLAIIAPIIVQLVQLAISRKREYVADASAVKFVRSPTGLIKALKKIKTETEKPADRKIPKALSPLFISDPFKKNLDNLLSTHPPLEKRIALLEKM